MEGALMYTMKEIQNTQKRTFSKNPQTFEKQTFTYLGIRDQATNGYCVTHIRAMIA